MDKDVRPLMNRVVLAGWQWISRVGKINDRTAAAAAFGSFGAGTSIAFPAATLMNTGSIHLGAGVLIGRQVTLSVGYGPDYPSIPERGLVIGDGCVIGDRCSLVAHDSIELGDHVWLGQDVFVCDASHGYQDPDLPIGSQFGGHRAVRIGTGSWIGHGAIILPGATIGRNVVVAAGSVVRGEVADHSVVGGAPARTLRTFEPGVGWVDSRGDVLPIRRGHFAGYAEGGYDEAAFTS